MNDQSLRTLRRNWQDKGGSDAVDAGRLEPFHKFIVGKEPHERCRDERFVDADPVNRLIGNERVYVEAI